MDMEEIKTLEIQDPVYEETYTAHIQKNGVFLKNMENTAFLRP